MVETRDDGGAQGRTPRRFEIRRTIMFVRVGEGWQAAVTFGPVAGDSTDPAGAQFLRIMTAFSGRTIRYRLDRAGALLMIDDEAEWWERFVAAVAGAAPKDRATAERTAAMANTLRALPGNVRRGILAEPLEPLLAAEEADRASAGTRNVSLPAQVLLGAPATITARETTTLAAGTVRIATDASGPLPAEAGTGSFHLTRIREADRTTGLLRSARDETVTELSGPPTARQTIVRTVSISDQVFQYPSGNPPKP